MNTAPNTPPHTNPNHASLVTLHTYLSSSILPGDTNLFIIYTGIRPTNTFISFIYQYLILKPNNFFQICILDLKKKSVNLLSLLPFRFSKLLQISRNLQSYKSIIQVKSLLTNKIGNLFLWIQHWFNNTTVFQFNIRITHNTTYWNYWTNLITEAERVPGGQDSASHTKHGRIVLDNNKKQEITRAAISCKAIKKQLKKI